MDEPPGYRRRDHERRQRSVAFTLARQASREAEASFADFCLDAMRKVAERVSRQEVESFGDGAGIEPLRPADRVRWEMRVRDRKGSQAAHALGFFQEIPYALLEDRQRQGDDFLPARALPGRGTSARGGACASAG